MNKPWEQLRVNPEKSGGGRDILFEIEQTIAELEVYLEAYPDDEIARIQYQQFLNKRANFTPLMPEAYDSQYHSEMQA
ncbi:MAG TPA: hypothetical protein VL921_17260 [Candidatus Udaeobacter sp.]|nr:hypothetical protein [Candidatus Udaeobacter sp.]